MEQQFSQFSDVEMVRGVSPKAVEVLQSSVAVVEARTITPILVCRV